uniref:Protein X n=1 Tax=Elaeophora elaphi TaxID=1147741 RepID=A0A0R3RHS2_9BILA
MTKTLLSFIHSFNLCFFIHILTNHNFGTNFPLAEDADLLALEFISLSALIKIVLFILIILLLLIIFKYLTLGTLFLKSRWLRHHQTQLSKTQFVILATPVKVEIDSATFEKQCDSLSAVVQLQAIASDGQLLLRPVKV